MKHIEETRSFLRELAKKAYERVQRNKGNQDILDQIYETALAWGYLDIWVEEFKDEKEIIEGFKQRI